MAARAEITAPQSWMPMLHLPTPGDHYSPRTGSAVMTVIHGMVAAHEAAGHAATVVVSRGTYQDRYPQGQVLECPPASPLPGRTLRAAEALVIGPLLGRRPFSSRPWRPSAAVAGDFGGWLFAHNAVAAGPLLPSSARRILYVHNTLLRTFSKREATRALGFFDDVVAVSGFLAQEVVDRIGAWRPVHVLHNGVDTVSFAPAERPATETIMYLGRVIPGKGVDQLVDAAVRLRHRDFRLRIVGRRGFSNDEALSPYERDLRRRAEPLGERVSFEPFVPRVAVPGLLNQASIVVVPSTAPEGFSLGMLEAMACGVPVVASDAGGIPEAAAGAALLYARGNVDQLTLALESLLANDGLAADLGARGRRRALALNWSALHLELGKALGA